MNPTLPIANRKPDLLSLPAELQVTIFEYAYPPAPELKLIGREDWRAKERRHLPIPSTPFPPRKVEEWMVSKEFFVSAARAFTQNQTFHAGHFDACPLSIRELTKGVAYAFLLDLKAPLYCAHYLKQLPTLKRLTLVVSDSGFRHIEWKDPCEDELRCEDFVQMPAVAELLKVRGLQALKLEADSVFLSSNRKNVFEDNVRRLEAFTSSYVTRPKQALTKHAVATPLYASSNVFFNGSHPPTGRPSDLADVATNDCKLYSNGFGIGVQDSAVLSSNNEDIPETFRELQALLKTDGSKVVQWIREAKRRPILL